MATCWRSVAANGELDEAGPGDVLFREGGLPESLYVLLDGRVSLTGTTPDASTTVIDILGPASSFVLANVLTNEPYQMGAQVVTNARLVRIAAEPMREMVTEASGGRHGHDARHVGGTGRHDAAGGGPEGARRGAAAGHLPAEPGDGPGAPTADFRLPVSKGLLAPWLGCRAENLSRAFIALRVFGVETHGSRVTAARCITPARLCGRARAAAHGSRRFGSGR